MERAGDRSHGVGRLGEASTEKGVRARPDAAGAESAVRCGALGPPFGQAFEQCDTCLTRSNVRVGWHEGVGNAQGWALARPPPPGTQVRVTTRSQSIVRPTRVLAAWQARHRSSGAPCMNACTCMHTQLPPPGAPTLPRALVASVNASSASLLTAKFLLSWPGGSLASSSRLICALGRSRSCASLDIVARCETNSNRSGVWAVKAVPRWCGGKHTSIHRA